MNDLDAAARKLNEVVMRQANLFADDGALHRLATIRRQQVAKYPPEHDAAHGAGVLIDAGVTLAGWPRPVVGHAWPWDDLSFSRLLDDPDRLLHAAALLLAAWDVQRGDELVDAEIVEDEEPQA